MATRRANAAARQQPVTLLAIALAVGQNKVVADVQGIARSRWRKPAGMLTRAVGRQRRFIPQGTFRVVKFRAPQNIPQKNGATADMYSSTTVPAPVSIPESTTASR
jgi:hypothetical protein